MGHLDVKDQNPRWVGGCTRLLCINMEELGPVPVPPCPDRDRMVIVVKHFQV